jgi:transcriptional regulator with XRE-family HTH domain
MKAALDLRGLSKAKVAAESGLDPAVLSHFEAGTRKPSFENLKKLADALKVTTDYLLGRSDTPDASTVAGQLHRNLDKLTGEDLKLTEEFVGMLLKRGQEKKEGQ